MKAQTKSALTDVILCAVCVGTVILCEIFMKNRSALWYYTAMSVLLVCPIAFCSADKEKYKHFSRTVLVVAIVAVSVVLCYVLYYTTGLSEKFSDFSAIAEYIRNSGVWGALIFIALTVFQVVVLPIPEAVTILLGVAIYGATWSFVLSVIGTLLGSLISFALGRIFGRRLCNWMFGEQNTDKYAEILNEKGRFLFIIMLLFPAFPDDMLCMIAGITSMSYAYFTIICLLTRPVMIGLTAYLGSGIIPFSGWGIPVWISLFCMMFVVFIVIGKVKAKIEHKRRG